MSTHFGDYGLPGSCVFLPIGLADVNNVIIYDEFSKTLMMVFTMFSHSSYCPVA